MRRVLILALAGSFFAARVAVAQPDAWIVAPQPLMGDVSALAADVSADGSRVVGTSYGAGGSSSGVIWDDVGEPFALVPAEQSYLHLVSRDGSTVVGSFVDQGALVWFRWTSSLGVSLLDVAEDSFWPRMPYVHAISTDGETILGSFDSIRTSSAVRWDAGVRSSAAPDGYRYARLVDIADTGRIAANEPWLGSLLVDGAIVTPLWVPPVGLSMMCHLTAMSADGSAMAGACESPVGSHVSLQLPVRWSERGGRQVSYLTDTFRGVATDVSADGDVVVGTVYDGPARRPFVWTVRTGFRFLEDLLEEAGVDASAVALDAVFEAAVSADGRTVVGDTFIARLPVEPVPEPSALAANGAALCAALFARFSRRAGSRRGRS